MAYQFICYPKCSTCQKAKKWLGEKGIAYTERHIAEDNPTAEELLSWIQKSRLPVKKFFNTSGNLYKEYQLKDKLPTLSEEEQIQLLSQQGMLVKRPLLIGENEILVGFKPEAWEALLK